MKFHDLAIGQRFELGGIIYIKTSPVLASPEQGTERKFMARSASVRPLDGSSPLPAAKTDQLLRADAVLAAFEAFHAACRGELEKLALPADQKQVLSDAIEEKRKAFLDRLA